MAVWVGNAEIGREGGGGPGAWAKGDGGGCVSMVDPPSVRWGEMRGVCVCALVGSGCDVCVWCVCEVMCL